MASDVRGGDSEGLQANGKRFVAFAMDAAIVAMAAMVVFALAGAPLFHYYDTAAEVASAAQEVTAIASASHLLSAEDRISPTDKGEIAVGTAWIYDKTVPTPLASKDFLYYYDCVYKYQPLSVDDYNAKFRFVGSAAQAAYAQLFVAPDPAGPIAFAPAYKSLLYGYSQGTDLGADATAAFNTALAAFKEIYRADWKELGQSPGYYVAYRSYLASNEKILFEAGGAALTSYVVAALVAYVALPFLLKEGRTIAKRALHLTVIGHGSKLSPWAIVLRGVIETLEFGGLAAFAPFFFIQEPALLLPIAAFGPFVLNIPIVVIASLLVTLLSGFLALFGKSKATLQDLASGTEVIDETRWVKARREAEKKALENHE